MNSRDYWKKRETEAARNTIRDEQEYNKRLNEIYQYMIANIERQVNNWYANYASKEGITMAEARGRVKHIDMERYERLAAKYVATHDFSEQANQEMALYNLTMKVNRLELLKAEINLELMAGFDDIEHEMRRDLIEAAMKEDRRLAGILGDSVIGNEQYARQLVNASFRNATFSERIWGRNMPDLRIHLEAELRNGLVQGIGSQELARRFRKHYGGSVKDTERLMATEMCRLQTAVQKESFERNGFKEYMFITSGNDNVCTDCEALHGRHFKVSEMQAGVNAPPMHPRCHCSAASYMDSDKYKRWIDALANGEDVRWNEFDEYEENKRKESEMLTERRRQRLEARRSRQSATAEPTARATPSVEVKYDSRVPKQQIDVLKALVNEYRNRLTNVTVGARRAAGNVDISGAEMRLNSKSIETAVHEFAHTMANSSADKYGLTNDKGFWKEIKKIYREYHKDVDKNYDVHKRISSYEYAQRSIDEFMAEAFAHAKMRELGIPISDTYGNDYTYSQRVLDAIDKYFKK